MLAVEHIQPKGLPAYQHLKGRWENFLLGCVNCNSTKGKKDVVLNAVLLPDRDNTFSAFVYSADGKVMPSPGLPAGLNQMAADTLSLTGLDREINATLDENDRQVAIDRISQRMQTWAIAEEVRDEVLSDPGNTGLRKIAAILAQESGFFSIWMTVFETDADMCCHLIDAFSGTRDSESFDPGTSATVSPAPNPDGLPYGGKL